MQGRIEKSFTERVVKVEEKMKYEDVIELGLLHGELGSDPFILKVQNRNDAWGSVER